MFNLFEATDKCREDILKFIKDYMRDSSYTLARTYISSINKAILVDKVGFRENYGVIFYRNFIKFFKEYCTEVTASGILLTLYVTGTELGCVALNHDAPLKLDEFTDGVDAEDFLKTDKGTLRMFDLRMSQCMINNFANPDNPEVVLAGGLSSMCTVDFIEGW